MKRIIPIVLAVSIAVLIPQSLSAEPRGGRGGGGGGAVRSAPAAPASARSFRAPAPARSFGASNRNVSVLRPSNAAVTRAPITSGNNRFYGSNSVSRPAPSVALGGRALASGPAPANIARRWDRRRDYAWNHHRYHWDGSDWVRLGIYPPYYYDDGGFSYGDPGYDGDYGYGPSDDYASDNVPPPAPAGDSLTADVQAALAQRGYEPGQPDGVMGEQTREAIAEFQEETGLAPTGRIDARLLRRLGLQ